MTVARPRKAKRVALRPSMDAATAMREVLREALAHVEANASGAAVGDDPEFLHQLRVGSRRLRAALRASRKLWRNEDVRALRRELRRLSAVAGPARDWDVLHERLSLRLKARADLHRRAAHRTLRRVLRGLDLGLPRPVHDPGPPLPAYARQLLEGLDRKIQRRARDTDWKDPAQRHAMRVRLRRLRYVAEFLAPVFPRADARPLIDGLKGLQDLLGDLNDIEVARRLLGKLGARERSLRRKRDLLRRLPDAWRAFTFAPRFWRATPLRRLPRVRDARRR